MGGRTGCGREGGEAGRERERAFACVTAAACVAAVGLAAAARMIYAACLARPRLADALIPAGFALLAYGCAVAASHAAKARRARAEGEP